MQSAFSRDLDDPDQPIKDAANHRKGTVRLRIQPMIHAADGQYKSWKQVIWTLECDSPAEALATKDAMAAFFATLARCGPRVVTAALKAMQAPVS